MENVRLIKLSNDEQSFDYMFKFIEGDFKQWKEKYEEKKGIIELENEKQYKLTDKEFYRLVTPKEERRWINNFMLLLDDEPIIKLSANKRNDIFYINFEEKQECENHNSAKIAIKLLLEQILETYKDLEFAIAADESDIITKKIAIQLGFRAEKNTYRLNKKVR